MYLWNLPTYREIWVKLSVQDDDLYSRFNYFLETDATHTLDEALKYLEEEREYKKLSHEEQQQQAAMQGHMQRGEATRCPINFPQRVLLQFDVGVKACHPERLWLEVLGCFNAILKLLRLPISKELFFQLACVHGYAHFKWHSNTDNKFFHSMPFEKG